MRSLPIRRPVTLAALSALLILAACAPHPARQESAKTMTPREACIASCNRAADVCGDQRAAQTSNPLAGVGAASKCRDDLQKCLAKC